jgi:Heavy metal binding domain
MTKLFLGLFVMSVSLLGIALMAQDLVYQCPMDPDIRSNKEGICSRCGMKLRAGIPEPVEFPMDLKLAPRVAHPGAKTQLEFTVRDPQNGRQIQHFEIVHEKLFHLFVIGRDLEFFVHDHPVFGDDAKFRYDITFPKPGLYRLLGDFYPEGATPQLIAKTVIVPGEPALSAPALTRDYSTKETANMRVSLTTDPPQPIAGQKTMMFFHLDPPDGIEKYIGAWGHMLAASDDLIDLIHTHPFIADGGPDMQFNVYFPREKMYRVWVQFQRKGVVNTAQFDIPVQELH